VLRYVVLATDLITHIDFEGSGGSGAVRFMVNENNRI